MARDYARDGMLAEALESSAASLIDIGLEDVAVDLLSAAGKLRERWEAVTSWWD